MKNMIITKNFKDDGVMYTYITFETADDMKHYIEQLKRLNVKQINT